MKPIETFKLFGIIQLFPSKIKELSKIMINSNMNNETFLCIKGFITNNHLTNERKENEKF